MEQIDKVAFLLLHGFGGSRFEMSFLAEKIGELGFKNISLPVLPGHEKDISVFKKTRFSHWAQRAEEEFLTFFHNDLKVIIIGLSMGGSIGMYLAQRYPVAGLVTIASPVYLYKIFPFEGCSFLLPFISILRFIKPIVKLPPQPASSKEIAPYKGYEGHCALGPLYSFIKALKNIRYNLPLISCPILVLHSPQDKIVPVNNAWEIITKVRSEIRKMELTPIREQITSRHVLTTHKETKDKVERSILDFITYLIHNKLI